MNRLPEIIRRLCEIEAAIGVLDSLSIRRMICETQDYILESQKKLIQGAGPKNLQLGAEGTQPFCAEYVPAYFGPVAKRDWTQDNE